jgi:hypothetical protein
MGVYTERRAIPGNPVGVSAWSHAGRRVDARLPVAVKGRGPAIAVLIAAVGLVCLASLRATRPRTLARLEGRPLTAAASSRGRVVWLEQASGKARLVVLRGSRRSVPLERASLSGLAVTGEAAYVCAQEGEGEALLRLDLGTAKAQTVARLAAKADEIVGGDGWVVWRESRGGDLPGVPFVVAADPITLLRACREQDRAVTTLSVLHGKADGPVQVRLLGVAGGDVYWLERRGEVEKTTIVRRAPLPAGPPETVTSEAGMRSAALGDDTLVWTAPSREAADPGSLSAVLERPLEGGREQVIGDWIGAQTELAVSGKTVYVREQTRLWRLGGTLGDQRTVRATTTGGAVSSIIGNSEYSIVRAGQEYVVTRRPLTWGARVRGLLP